MGNWLPFVLPGEQLLPQRPFSCNRPIERVFLGRCTLTPATINRGMGTVVWRLHSPKWQGCEGWTAVNNQWSSPDGKWVDAPEEEMERKYVRVPQMAAVIITSTDSARKLFHTVPLQCKDELQVSSKGKCAECCVMFVWHGSLDMGFIKATDLELLNPNIIVGYMLSPISARASKCLYRLLAFYIFAFLICLLLFFEIGS